MIKSILLRTSLFVASLLSAAPALSYSGEDLLRGRPWHHEDITCRALVGDNACGVSGDELYMNELGFTPDAAHAIAWHADYIDSYLYSPIWWASAAGKGTPVRSIRHRYLAGMANYWQLASLHFDDLNSSSDVQDTWQRYMAGTLIGLNWAAETNDVQSAYNILGVSLHANQDFYSHSTWINSEGRRKMTYLEAKPALIEASALETGAYKRAVAAVQHGKYNFACTVYERPAFKSGLTTLCSKAFPTANFDFCTEIRRCEQGNGQEAKIEVPLLPNTSVILFPPGIAMDNTHLAKVGAEQRGLHDTDGVPAPAPNVRSAMRVSPEIERLLSDAVRSPAARDIGGIQISDAMRERLRGGVDTSGGTRDALKIKARDHCRQIINYNRNCRTEPDYLFAESKHLAITSSQQWMRKIDTYMTSEHADFWQKVKDCGNGRNDRCQGQFNYKVPPDHILKPYENYQKFPFQFLSAGHDGPIKRTTDDDYFLRIEIDTANERGSGTSADVKVLGPNGEEFLLDYLSMADPHSAVRGLIAYDDLESGDKQVYTVGPFRTLPSELRLFNDSSSRKEVRKAFFRSVGRRFENGFEGARRMLRNTEDYVGDQVWMGTAEDIETAISTGISIDGGRYAVRAQPGVIPILVNGGDEGVYRINVNVRRTGWTGSGTERSWSEYQFTLRNIDVLRESTVDGATRDDEPFFYFGLSSYGLAEPEFKTFGPYSNIGTNGNDRDNINLDSAFAPVRMPRGGGIALAVQAWESDKEKSRDRQALENDFRGVVNQSDIENYPEFISEWGRNLGGDWKIANLRVWGFQRGEDPKYGRMLNANVNRWVNEDQTATFPLDTSAVTYLGVNLEQLHVDRRMAPLKVRGSTATANTTLADPANKDEPKKAVKELPVIDKPIVKKPFELKKPMPKMPKN